MKTAVLEINDQNLMIRTEDGVLFTQPGFAQLTENGIETGEQARARAWLKPQYSYHDYWRQLNQNALPTQCILARHHADIAYAQLKQMLSQANSPKLQAPSRNSLSRTQRIQAAATGAQQ